jgi:hypothetical protein
MELPVSTCCVAIAASAPLALLDPTVVPFAPTTRPTTTAVEAISFRAAQEEVGEELVQEVEPVPQLEQEEEVMAALRIILAKTAELVSTVLVRWFASVPVAGLALVVRLPSTNAPLSLGLFSFSLWFLLLAVCQAALFLFCPAFLILFLFLLFLLISMNGGQCTDLECGYQCACVNGFTGSFAVFLFLVVLFLFPFPSLFFLCFFNCYFLSCRRSMPNPSSSLRFQSLYERRDLFCLHE